ncbi:HAD family hydrolase [Chengkuizengella sediminis]|uniref:HAD family hydrolase n=1 Tax=Chengkuizengella sediminis TaxID=1885917 RepID=UPI001389DF34|nr:HAD-IA family hydrolase [Chengkuizengella sediminis]NDI36240.1 HAD-IA family hydrolase [Chengkuizengella sediminis]
MIKSVIFDLDGTLLNRNESLRRFIDDQYNKIDALKKIDKQTYIQRFIDLDDHGYVWKDKVYGQLIKEYHLSITVEELLEDYINSFQHHCIGFPGLMEMLAALKNKGLKLAIISNGYGMFQYQNIQALEIENYFDFIVISEWEGIKKPEPEIFRNTLKKLGVKADEAIYFGDHPDNDVIASRNVGMRALWKESNLYDVPSENDGIIRDLLDVNKIINELQKQND